LEERRYQVTHFAVAKVQSQQFWRGGVSGYALHSCKSTVSNFGGREYQVTTKYQISAKISDYIKISDFGKISGYNKISDFVKNIRFRRHFASIAFSLF
jgi:hypothetical protein